MRNANDGKEDSSVVCVCIKNRFHNVTAQNAGKHEFTIDLHVGSGPPPPPPPPERLPSDFFHGRYVNRKCFDNAYVNDIAFV